LECSQYKLTAWEVQARKRWKGFRLMLHGMDNSKLRCSKPTTISLLEANVPSDDQEKTANEQRIDSLKLAGRFKEARTRASDQDAAPERKQRVSIIKAVSFYAITTAASNVNSTQCLSSLQLHIR
jgi:hypothetical protein